MEVMPGPSSSIGSSWTTSERLKTGSSLSIAEEYLREGGCQLKRGELEMIELLAKKEAKESTHCDKEMSDGRRASCEW